ncbi:MAG: Mur ligase family protein, partial [Trueperaceae bacterium]
SHARPWDGRRLASWLEHDVAEPTAGRITGATHHSGRVRPGDLFFALPGANGHGIDHADDALAAGASLVISDRRHPRGVQVPDPAATLLRLGAWARARLRGPVVAVTGSVGKTTAKALLAAALDADASEGNLNTPHALAGRLFRAYADGRPRPLVLELGIDRIGEMEVLTDLVRPDMGLLTAVGASHLDGLGDRATVLREKSRLLTSAPRAVAADDAYQRLPEALRARTARYGLDHPHADASGTQAGSPLAPTLHLSRPTDLRTDLPGPGRGLAESAVGALLVADLLGVPLRDAAARLAHAPLEPGRLTVRTIGGLTVIDDSYNANPGSLLDALEVLRAGPGPHRALLGDMRELGSESEAQHRALGEATRDLQQVLYVGSEAEAVRSGNPEVQVLHDAQVAEAIDRLPLEGTLLIKASRSLAFERWVQRLHDREAVS